MPPDAKLSHLTYNRAFMAMNPLHCPIINFKFQAPSRNLILCKMNASSKEVSRPQEQFPEVADLQKDLINGLPCELLQEIFAVVVLNEEEEEEEDPRKRIGRFRLSLVCKEWWDLIEACPTLWTSVTITDFSPDHSMCYSATVGNPQATFPKLMRILERSAGCDIDVKIDIWAPPEVPPDFQDVVSVCRWITSPTTSELRLALSNLIDTLEILSLVCAVRDVEGAGPQEHLILPHVNTFSIGYGRTINEVGLILQFLDLPAVRHLNIKDCHIAPLPASDRAFIHVVKRLPLHQIVSLKLSNVRFEVQEDCLTSQDVLEGNFNAEEDLPVPLRFIRKLTAIKQLSLNSPCPMFMYFATYPRTLSRVTGDDEVKLDDLARLINLSTVETMNIEADNWEIRDWDPALTFLHNRFQWPSAQDGVYHGVVMDTLNIILPYKLSEMSQYMHPPLEEVIENKYTQLARHFDLEWMLDDDDLEEGGDVGFGLCLEDLMEDEA
ncbi:uncharacterized protein EV420DRAFT_1711682 [Desarmillaria tabescens]|uniref:F-box domain-containing protein n=1 Tax=Armillaria tabescens TaxID=1929756 RepID=A0AA39JTC4_ARMTA|nr:uncharacterized protein EV420DRAFT_1711682 [Desarmillaria tabescens]KAK0448424.1 hypothetical protein EV420DRAFT_1711682 [Desarmillaria tabescens]